MSSISPFRWTAAVESDGPEIWRWRNDPETRRNSHNTGKIGLAHHMKWFRGRLADQKCLLLVARGGGKALGQIRLERRGRAAEISITVSPAARGKGVGTWMLSHLPHRMNGARLSTIVARVKPDNVASVVAFVKAGFRFARFVRCGGESVYRFEKTIR
ncbi:MAG: GNAT family N-acetyltransferase [Elusimicrobia bacterium]|nr:GNAT family N-acetyltransferase [Elusimicrobiota bacterium]